MNKNRKIGLVLAFRSSNFGCQLQAFATQYMLERLGFETYIIEYRRPKFSLSSVTFAKGIFNYLYLSRKERRIRFKTRERVEDETFLLNKNNRKFQSEQFINKYLKRIVRFSSYKDLKEFANTFFACIMGSDQKWLPGFCYDKISSLSFAPDKCKRISFATSLGVSEYPQFCKNASKSVWRTFNALSVREAQGVDIVNSICGENRCVRVLDPTYLISKDEWQQIIPLERKIKEPYVLCYFLGNDDKAKLCARRFADSKGIKLVTILGDESFSNLDLEYADEVLSNINPTDFVNLVRFASYVFTDSFHGMTFSIINNREFFVFYRKRADALVSRNSRIDNLLNIFNLHSRLITDPNVDWNSIKLTNIDFNEINNHIVRERENALNFLITSLQENED